MYGCNLSSVYCMPVAGIVSRTPQFEGGCLSSELPRTAVAALAGCQHERHGYVSSPVVLASLGNLAGGFGCRSFPRDEHVNRRGGRLRTVAIGGRERILVRFARLKMQHFGEV